MDMDDDNVVLFSGDVVVCDACYTVAIGSVTDRCTCGSAVHYMTDEEFEYWSVNKVNAAPIN